MIHLLHETLQAEGMRYFAAAVPDATPASRDDIQAEPKKFDGSWVLVEWMYNGVVPPMPYGRIIISFAAGEFTIRNDRGVFEKGRFEGLAPAREPKEFEYLPTEINGQPARLRYPGIYRFQDDRFIACIGYGGQRPRAFSAEAESMQELVVYKRLNVAVRPVPLRGDES
jgi:uncharacterized protein (TIGR03067 family)